MGSSSIFKSICEEILAPCGVKVGGYKDEIFERLNDEEREQYSCQICYSIAKDPTRCSNKHLFCASCIFAWSMTSSENTSKCPVCRVVGVYREDVELSPKLNNLAVRCGKCNWKGQLEDYRVHSHGFEEVGISPKLAGLPPVRSRNGELVFPDIPHDDSFGVSIEASRREHQRNYLNMELELVEGQARLAFLLDLFEEDLQRHRDNLHSLVSLQRRYNAEQFEEVMRLEAELGQITANLLRLIDNASEDVNSITARMRGDDRTPTSRYPNNETPNRRVMRGVANNELLDLAADLHSLGPAPEPQRPIRRARFFQSRYNARLPAHNAAISENAGPSIPENSTSTDETSASSFSARASPVPNPTQTPTNLSSRSTERNNQRLLNRRESETRSITRTSPVSRESPSREANSRTSSITPRAPVTASQPGNPYVITYPPRRPGASDNASPANPYTITYPPNRPGNNASSVTSFQPAMRRVSRQEFRQNATERQNRRLPET